MARAIVNLVCTSLHWSRVPWFGDDGDCGGDDVMLVIMNDELWMKDH